MIRSMSELSTESLDLSNPQILLSVLKQLKQTIEQDGHSTFERWRSQIQQSDFLASALNLAHYLALRCHDLRPLQVALMPWGLSSLGRIEARVMPNLDAVIATLTAICDKDSNEPPAESVNRPDLMSFFEGNHLLQRRTEELFGPSLAHRRVRIMVTLPTEAATDYDLVRTLLKRGATCLRINCAHDDPALWQGMIDQVRRAEQETGKLCKIMMDLGGPKIRTGAVVTPPDQSRVFRGDQIVLLRNAPESNAECKPEERSPVTPFQIQCSVPDILDQLEVGALVYIDDGKIRTQVVNTHYLLPNGQSGLHLEVTHARPKGVKLRSEKGLNFPNTVLSLNPLTQKDRQDLDFVAVHADIIGYSFVQRSADLELLQHELDERLQRHRPRPAIVAKIETAMAVNNLPELIIQAAGKQPFGVMIARGDLAVEIGYQRLAEIQEEILWLCEAAHIPVIWATQVLENLVKDGAPSRGEMTDAAMAERAECVMLNKGPFIAEAVTILDDVLTRMEAHQLKKTPQLRALHSWSIANHPPLM